MATAIKVGEFKNYGANLLRVITTEAGVYRVGLGHGTLRVLGPDGKEQQFPAPGGQDCAPLVVDGELVVEYTAFRGYLPGTQKDDPTRDLMRLPTGIKCGAQVGASGTVLTGPPGPQGDTGPQGPPGAPGAKGDDAMAITGEQMEQLSRLTAERVWDVPPRADNNGLPEPARFGTRAQQDMAIMWLNQAFLQFVGMTADEAAANLQAAIKAGTYVPKTQP